MTTKKCLNILFRYSNVLVILVVGGVDPVQYSICPGWSPLPVQHVPCPHLERVCDVRERDQDSAILLRVQIHTGKKKDKLEAEDFSDYLNFFSKIDIINLDLDPNWVQIRDPDPNCIVINNFVDPEAYSKFGSHT